jgi:type IV pilus assembly protein PilW
MKKSKEIRDKGFTLIEMMVTLVISSILVAGIFYYFTTQEKALTTQGQITEMQQHARGGIDFMGRELRMIGYGVNTGEIITEADGDAITFLADIDSDGSIETIRYSLDTTDLQLAREVGSGGGIPLAENIPDTGLVFQYYDDFDNDLSVSDPLPLTADNRKAIRRINVSLTARTARPDPEYSANNGYRTMSFTTDIRPRNLGLVNLGCSVPVTPTLDGTNTAGLNSTYPCQLHVEWLAVTTDINGSPLGTECALTKYLVYYDISSGSYGNSVDVSYSDTDITLGAPPACTYYVTVSAVNSGGEGSKATEAVISDNTVPGTPAGLSLVPLDNEIDLKWNVPTSDNCDIAGYNIYRSTYDNLSYSLLTTTSGLGSIYNDTSVTNCTTYYYKVQAVDICANEMICHFFTLYRLTLAS